MPPFSNRDSALDTLSQANHLSVQTDAQYWPLVVLLVTAVVYTGLELAAAIRGNVK